MCLTEECLTFVGHQINVVFFNRFQPLLFFRGLRIRGEQPYVATQFISESSNDVDWVTMIHIEVNGLIFKLSMKINQ